VIVPPDWLLTDPPPDSHRPAPDPLADGLPLIMPAFTTVAVPLALTPMTLPVIVPPDWLATCAPVVSTTPLAAPVTRP